MNKDEFEAKAKEYVAELNANGHEMYTHNFLSKIKIKDIELKREHFLSRDLRKMNDEELFNAILEAISFDIDGQQVSFLKPRIGTYPKGTRFYRIRKLGVNDHYIPLKALSKKQDAWNAPEKFCKLGRLNKEGESLLYTVPQIPFIAVEEMKVQDNEWFLLIVYESIKDIKANMIGTWNDSEEFSEDENLKMRMINNTLGMIFTKDVGKGTEFLYRASERIAKDYFDLPKEIQDAWCYPSVAAKKGYNVCFRPEVASEVLSLVGIQVCKVCRIGGGYQFTCPIIAIWEERENRYEYLPVNSEECGRLFPEIQISK